MEDIASYLKTLSTLIENHLDGLVPNQAEKPYRELFESARYSLLMGGKRLRPVLTLATTEFLGGNISKALTPACAIEMIHAYSLIHDDLPSMDNDDFRRGKPSLHRAYPEGHAILTGDFLLTYAFEILATHPNLSAEQKMQLIAVLSKRAGSDGMIGGQVMDLENANKDIKLDLLTFIHRKKTGAMISAAVEFGGIVADVGEENLKHLREFGEKIGLAFQIIDDILDVTASHEKHGRAVATDVLNDKVTYVTLLGIEGSKKQAKKLYDEAIDAIHRLPGDPSPLVKIADFIVNRPF